MRTFWDTLLHGFFGGAAVGAAELTTAQPFTARNVLLPIIASAATSIISLLIPSPLTREIK